MHCEATLEYEISCNFTCEEVLSIVLKCEEKIVRRKEIESRLECQKNKIVSMSVVLV